MLLRVVRALSALLAALAGLALLLPAVLPGAADLLRDAAGTAHAPPSALAHLLHGAGGCALLLLARGLWVGSRPAAGLVCAALGASAVLGLGRGVAPALSLAQLGAAGLLAAARDAFPRAVGRRAAQVAAGLAVLAAAAAYALAAIALLVADEVRTPDQAVDRAGAWLLAGSWWLRSGAPLALGLDALVIAALAAAATSLHALLRPAAASVGHTPAEHERAAALVARYAQDSLDPFMLREDKAFHFAHGGVLGYRTLRETAVVAGDPVGPPGAGPAILRDFEAFATARGWRVVLTGASDRSLAGYRALGLRTLCLGEEAVVDTGRFTLEGSAAKPLRKAVRRVARHGWTVEILRADALPEPVVAELAALEAAWRARQPRLQGFAMTLGRLWGAQEDGSSLYVLGRRPGGELGAFLSFVPYPGGLSLDAMRRLCNEPNGVTEALIVAAVEHARAAGVREVSLNFAGFSHVLVPRGELTRGERLIARALGLVHGRFQLERLVRFDERFGPTWRRRHLVYRGRLGLPRAALRVLQAEAYLPAPRSRELTARWMPRGLPVPAAPARPVGSGGLP
jgi:lysyl-tRNA synthetase class 2